MFPVYNLRGYLLCKMTKILHYHLSYQQLKQYISRNNFENIEDVNFIDSKNQIINQQSFSIQIINFAVTLQNADHKPDLSPIKIYIRKIDKFGLILFLHAYTTIYQLKANIHNKMNILPQQQLLIYEGTELNDDEKTLLQLQIKNSKIIHVVPKQKYTEKQIKIYYQLAKMNSNVFSLQVNNCISIIQLKKIISKQVTIPIKQIGISYCGQILQNEQKNLIEYNFINGCYITIADKRNGVIIKKEHKTINQIKDNETVQDNAMFLKKQEQEKCQNNMIRFANSVIYDQSQNLLDTTNMSIMEYSYQINKQQKLDLEYSKNSHIDSVEYQLPEINIPKNFNKTKLLNLEQGQVSKNSIMNSSYDQSQLLQ